MTMKVPLVLAGIGGLLVLSALAVPGPAGAQAGLPDDYGVVDRDYGVRLRHAPAYRGQLNVRRSFRAEDANRQPLWDYRWFDHPVPSYQFFQQPQVFRWSEDWFPSAGRGWGQAYYPSGYGRTYRYRGRCGCW
jgi:hypothetical protein